jgi:hypothetical protein
VPTGWIGGAEDLQEGQDAIDTGVQVGEFLAQVTGQGWHQAPAHAELLQRFSRQMDRQDRLDERVRLQQEQEQAPISVPVTRSEARWLREYRQAMAAEGWPDPAPNSVEAVLARAHVAQRRRSMDEILGPRQWTDGGMSPVEAAQGVAERRREEAQLAAVQRRAEAMKARFRDRKPGPWAR